MTARQKMLNRSAHEQKAGGILFRYKLLLFFAAVVIVITVQYLTRTQQKTEATNILYRANTLRKEIGDAKNMNADLTCKRAELQRPEYVMRKLKEHGVYLAVAPLERVIHVSMPQMAKALAEEQERVPQTPVARPAGSLLVSTHRGNSND